MTRILTDDDVLMDLRNGVVSGGDWVGDSAVKWPDISIDNHQREGIQRRESGDPSQLIRTYHLCPDGRKRVWDGEERVGQTA